MPTIDTLDIQISSTLTSTDKALDNLIKKLGVVTTSLSRIGGTTGTVSSGMNKISDSMTKATKSTKSLSSVFGSFYANYFWVVRGIKALNNSIQGTADYIEAFNYFEVSFNKIASEWKQDYEKFGYDNAEAYARSFAERAKTSMAKLSGVQIDVDTKGNGLLTETGMKNLGLNIQTITQYASQLASVTNSVGQTGEVSLRTSTAFTKLAGDISSLFNVDYSSVATNLQSGLIGQSRALYKYGIDITNATLQTYAYKLGVEKAVSEMTQAEKMQLRMIAILDQSKVSWGDLANTINSPSNMLRQFKTNLKEAGMVLGQLFVPLLSKVLPIVNGVTIAIKRLLANIAGILGIKLDLSSFGQGATDLGDSYGDISDSLDDVADSAKKAKAGLRGFDELKTINMPDSSSSGAGGVGGSIDLTDEIIAATEEYERVWQEAYDKMEQRAQAFANTIEKMFKPIEKLFQDIAIGDWFAVGQDVSNIVSGIFNFFADAIDRVDWYGLGTKIGDFLAGVDWIKILSSIGRFLWEALNASIELWAGSFDAAPIETTIITGIALLKWTGLGPAVLKSLGKAIASGSFMNSVGKLFVGGITTGIYNFVSGMTTLPGTPTFDVLADKLLIALDEELKKLIPDWAYNFLDSLGTGIVLGAVAGSWLPGGTIAGAIIGGILGALNGIEINGQPILQNIINGIFNWDFTKELFGEAKGFFQEVQICFERCDWLGIGVNIVQGIIQGILGCLAFIVEPIGDLFTATYEAICDVFGINSPAEEMKPLGENILYGITEGFKAAFFAMPEAIQEFYRDYVAPWFTKEKWEEQIGSIKDALSNKWTSAKNWWNSKPALKKISTTIFNIKTALQNAWNSALSWWNTNKPSLSAITANIKIPRLSVTWDTAGWAAEALQKLGLKGFPNFNVAYYATGGFPEDGWFRANHGEIMGKFDNGQSVVANNMQITEGISSAVQRGNQQLMQIMQEELAATRRQNEILLGILNKKLEISPSDSFNATRIGAEEYTRRTGNPAFSY